MKGWHRFGLGAAGSLSPSLLNVLLVDAATVWANATPVTLIFYGIRLLVLSLVGGLWAALHHSEMNPAQLFQFGIVAPALVLGGFNAVNVPKGHALWATPVYAQSKTAVCDRTNVLYFAMPIETPGEQRDRGLYGRQSDRTWYVVTDVYRTFNDAELARVGVGARMGVRAKVYCAPSRNQPYVPFAVVVAENVNQARATVVMNRALALGYVHTFLFNVANP